MVALLFSFLFFSFFFFFFLFSPRHTPALTSVLSALPFQNQQFFRLLCTIAGAASHAATCHKRNAEIQPPLSVFVTAVLPQTRHNRIFPENVHRSWSCGLPRSGTRPRLLVRSLITMHPLLSLAMLDSKDSL
jgi:hypothetical protein